MVRQGAKFSGTIPGILTPPGLVTQLLTDRPTDFANSDRVPGNCGQQRNPTGQPQPKIPQVAPRNGRCSLLRHVAPSFTICDSTQPRLPPALLISFRPFDKAHISFQLRLMNAIAIGATDQHHSF